MNTATPADADQPPVPLPPGATAATPSRRRWLPGLGLAALLALIVVGLWPRPLPVEVATVLTGPLQVAVEEEGMTQVRHRYVVAAPVAGHLQRIPHKPGARVVAGETVLAVLEPGGADLLDARSQAQAEARLAAARSARALAEARRESAAAALALARLDHERLRRLAAAGALSRQEIDTAETRWTTARQDDRAAEFNLQVATHELAVAEALLLRAQPGGAGGALLPVTSPVSGRVLRVWQESARLVPGGFPLMEVGDPADLEVRIEVLSRDGVGIEPGARVWLEQWGGDAPLEARVRWVEPAAFTKISTLGVEEQRVNVIADLVGPPARWAGLGDAFRVEARIVRWEGSAIRQVPAGALFQRGGRWQTFVVEGGAARLREITPGRSDGVHTEIVAGLELGEQVIVYPGDRVRAGSRVSGIDVEGR
jgi:HlyD family secretion protein